MAAATSATMRQSGLAWRSPAAVFREWTRLTAYENRDRPLNLGPLVAMGAAEYDALEPVQWPMGPDGGRARLFTDGRFATPDGRARMVPVRPGPPAEAVDGALPLALNTGRLRDQWHTMTRTGLAPELCRHAPEPVVEVHPLDAEAWGIRDGALARVITKRGEAVALARLTDRQRRGDLFMPMHFTEAFAPSGRANRLTAPHIDGVSGQPEFKHTPARIRSYGETWRGFFLARRAWDPPAGLDLIWRRTPQDGCHLHQFAGRGDEHERGALRKALARTAPGEAIRLEDAASGGLREAWLREGRLERVLFLTAEGRLPPPDWLAEQFLEPLVSAEARVALLAGQPPGPLVESGPQVCACLNVSARRIDGAIAAGALNIDAVGRAVGAGTGCGSCRPEILRMIRARRPERIDHAA